MAEEVQSVRDSLEAAFDAVEKAAPPPPRAPVERETASARQIQPDSREKEASERQNRISVHSDVENVTEAGEPARSEAPEAPERAGDRPRDQFGRFLSSTPPGPAERAQAQPQEPGEAERNRSQQTSTADQPEPRADEPDDGPAIAPPQAWSAAEKETFRQLPRPAQQAIDRRERDIQRHLQQRAEQANVLEPIAQALQPYQQKLALRGVHPAAALSQLLAVQDLLDSDPIQGVAHVARVYGVDLRQYATAFAQAQNAPDDPRYQQLAQEVAQQRQLISNWQRGAEQQEFGRITAEVQQFAANTRDYPYFEQVRERMAQLMQSGATSSLSQAYRLACADSEQVSSLMAQDQQARAAAARRQAETQAAERARRAAVSVSGSPYGGSSQGARKPKSGSVRDAIESAMEQVADR